MTPNDPDHAPAGPGDDRAWLLAFLKALAEFALTSLRRRLAEQRKRV